MARTKQTKRDTPSAAAGPSTRKSPRNLSPRNLSRRRQGENENDTSENESESVASERVSESEPEDDGADDGVSEREITIAMPPRRPSMSGVEKTQ